ncbi:MAG TPA: translation elongation factor Ts [Bacteriovoracaceae bacterium]|nr:translation elongation factor Ts [Bacteriovoracaceae bacterium]
MAYTAADVKNLRETTGAGMMDCKKALDESNGDFDKAVDYLRAKGLAAAAKKQSRVAAEGMITACVKGKIAALVEVNCETDFVAKNESFQAFANDAANVAVDGNLGDIDALLAAKGPAGIIKDNITDLTLKIGEKIDLRRVALLKLEGNGMIGSYVHSGKIGVLVSLATDKDITGNEDLVELAKDISMHIAAANPQFLNASEIDEDYKNKEAEIYTAQLKEQGKPEAMIPNIVKGKLNKLASEVCLYEQSFVKDPDITVAKLIENVSNKVGANIKVEKFIKLNLGEGIEKRSENFAEEIAKITGQN